MHRICTDNVIACNCNISCQSRQLIYLQIACPATDQGSPHLLALHLLLQFRNLMSSTSLKPTEGLGSNVSPRVQLLP